MELLLSYSSPSFFVLLPVPRLSLFVSIALSLPLSGCLRGLRTMPWPPLSCWGARPTTAVPPVTSPVPVTRVQALLTGGRSPCLRGEALQKYLLLLSTSSSSLVSFEHLTVHPLITQSSLQFICSNFHTAFNHKMHWSQNEACDWQAYTRLCLHRFAHNRHTPLPAERQMVAEGGSSGKSTPSWPRVEDSSDRPPSG